MKGIDQVNEKMLKELFDDEETRKNLILLVEIGQRERFLQKEQEKLQEEFRKLETKISNKHKINNPFLGIFARAVLQNEEYKEFLKKYGNDYKSKEAKK